MALTPGNIVLPGPAKVYVAPESEAAPANSVAKGSAWAGNWVEVGLTKGGVVAKTSVEHLEVEMDQYNAPLVAFITQQGITVTFAAGEGTLTNLKQALGHGTVTSGSTESTFGMAATDGFPTFYAVGFECYAPGADSGDNWYRRLIVHKGLMVEGPELSAKKEEEQLIAYNVKGYVDTTESAAQQLWLLIDRVVD